MPLDLPYEDWKYAMAPLIITIRKLKRLFVSYCYNHTEKLKFTLELLSKLTDQL